MDNSMAQKKRKAKNFLLQPVLQVKFGAFSITIAVVFVVIVGAILYYQFAQLTKLIIELTDVGEEIRDIINAHIMGTFWWLALVLSAFVLINLGVSVLYTHRLVGPTIAFRRHIRQLIDGNYQARTALRKADAFSEVADELNLLSETLQKKSYNQTAPNLAAEDAKKDS